MKKIIARIIYLTVRDFPIFNYPVLRKIRNAAYSKIFSASGINVDYRCRIQASHYVDHQHIKIGKDPHLGCNTLIDYTGTIEIGDRFTISDGAAVFTHSHPINGSRQDWRDESIKFSKLMIGDDVWIATNAIILESVNNIGCGAVVAAGSVVTKDIPAGAVVAGNPARIVRTRNYVKIDK